MPKDGILPISALDLLKSYQSGLFPMADSASDSGFFLMKPPMRAVFYPEQLHIPQSLQKFARTCNWNITINQDFIGVIDLCRMIRPERPDTWINKDICTLFIELHYLGHAHSIEVWNGTELIGGLYGLSVGGVFCAESMVSLQSNASSMALIYLMKHLTTRGYALCDVQFSNPHLERFHVKILSEADYLKILNESLHSPLKFS
jgi:leucyl/phenylalanyl-tRNA--protein transferase